MTTIVPGDLDRILGAQVVAHLDAQLISARRLLQIVLEQGAAIRARDVTSVVTLTGMLQAELQSRSLLENERSMLLEHAGARLGVASGAVTLSLLEELMTPEIAEEASERSSVLRGMLDEIQREHMCNRALMHQELAFLDHLLGLADGRADIGYDAGGERPTATPTLGAMRRVLDMEA